MKELLLTLRAPAVAAPEAYERIKDFAQYPDLVEEVRSVTVIPQDGGESHCHTEWEVVFRNGPLKWTEVDYFQNEKYRIVFEQLVGDFHVFRGAWQVSPMENACEITFAVTFDFGIPSMAGVLEPVASRVLKEGIAIIVHRLMGGVHVMGDADLAAAINRRLAVSGDMNTDAISA